MSAKTQFREDLVSLCRAFGVTERDQICCGTVTVPQCIALQTLLEGPHEVGELAERLSSAPSTVTRLVDGLVKRGFVHRERDESDRRKVSASLTEEGKREANRLVQATDGMVKAILGGVPKERRADVMEAVSLLREAVLANRDAIRSCC